MDSTDVFEEMDPHTDGTVFGIFLNSSKPIFFRAKNRTDRNQWMLSIDSLIANSSLYLIPELERVFKKAFSFIILIISFFFYSIEFFVERNF